MSRNFAGSKRSILRRALFLSCGTALSLALVSLMGFSTTAFAAESSDSKGVSLKGGGGSGAKADDIVAFINLKIREGWEANQLRPSVKALDHEWCRRAYLDLVGRLPTVKELETYLKDSPATRKATLIDKLMGELPKNGKENDDYLEEYANNWSTVYTILLVGRPMGNQNNNPTNRDGMSQYLRRSFLENKPYDRMVTELVSAEGATAPGMENYNGAANFYVNKLQEEAAEATSRTARYFLGMQVQCTQCHNHPFNDWKQDQFWSFNAFFRQTRMQNDRRGGQGMQPEGRLYNQDYSGAGGGDPRNAELFYELRNGTQAVAYPKFVDGTKINPSGYVNEVNRRAELAKLIVKSEFFGKAIANRMWSHFLGYGFTKPVDDMGPHNPASHPELLERLGTEFVAQGNDLKKLMKWIMLSDAYSLSSRMSAANKKDDPSLGVKPMFSHFYMRMMDAEQLYDSIETVRTQKILPQLAYDEYLSKRNNVLSQFTITFGNDEGDDATTFNGTIPQALMLFNGSLTRDCIDTSANGGGILPWLFNNRKGSEIADFLFLAAYGRKPSSGELGQLTAALRSGDATTSYQDLLWSLINSNEFLFIY